MIANGLITCLSTLYRQVFQLPLQTSLAYGFTTSACGVAAALLCALYIDKVGLGSGTLRHSFSRPPMAILAVLGADSAQKVLVFATASYAIIQTVTFSLYLYSAELYPTRLRAVGAGFGSAWLRIASSIGPLLIGWVVGSYSINYVFVVFGIVLAIGGVICLLFAPETKGRVLEELSP
jgi:putative MFS transporter